MEYSLIDQIETLLNTGHEGEYWDFKQVWHLDNEHLLHDILCFANTVHNKNCYILIGVSDAGEIVGVSAESRRKQADILDLLGNTVFAGDNTPEIRVDTFKINGKEIDILTILNSFNVPFYLKGRNKKYNSIKDGFIYTRIGDKNTPINQNASIQQIEMLWKKRFGLTQQPPLEQIVDRLEYKLEWVFSGNAYYNMYKPEFRLIEEDDDEYDRRIGEFYVYSQYNSSFSYKDFKIVYNQTVLKEFQLVVLDSGRYITPVPTWGYICRDEHDINYKFTYKFFLKDSIDYKIQQFFFDTQDTEKVYAKRRLDEVILYYKNQDEQISFEYYLENKQRLVEKYVSTLSNDRLHIK